jgi:uncharacterized membrane protein
VSAARAAAAGAAAAAAVAYPFVVWFALGRFDARNVGFALLALAVLRLLLIAPSRARAFGGALLAPALALAAIAAATALTNSAALLLAAPALASLVLLASFGRTLHTGPPFVERLARATNPDLSPGEISYCRSVTRVWCAFFAANAAVVLALAALAPRAWWAAWAGFGAYLAIGLLFASEYVVRRARFGRFEEHPIDRVLLRLLGARAPR